MSRQHRRGSRERSRTHRSRSGEADSDADASRQRASESSGRSDRHRRRSSRSRKSGGSASGGKTSRGMRFSLLCLAFASLGLVLVVLTEIISPSSGKPSLTFLNILGSAAVLAALATGGYAAATLVRRDSRRVKKRTLVGMIIAACSGVVVVSNLYDKQRQLGPSRSMQPQTAVAVAEAAPEDNAIIKPGWYGEILTSHILLTVTSYEKNAAESRRFNRGLFKPVSYATLSVMNNSQDLAVSVIASDTRLQLDDGTDVPILSFQELLAHSTSTPGESRLQLKVDRQVAPGTMAPDIPICMEADFSWSRVVAVRLNLGAIKVTVPGRFLTASEKAEALQVHGLAPRATPPSPHRTRPAHAD